MYAGTRGGGSLNADIPDTARRVGGELFTTGDRGETWVKLDVEVPSVLKMNIAHR